VSPGEQHSGNPLDYALYAVFVHVGASIRMGHYVVYIKDPRGGWFKVDDHKASPVFLSEVLQFQAYMLCYIHKVQTDVKIDHVKQQTAQVFDGMDEDETPDAVGIPSLPKSKTCTEPEQIASHLAPTVEELTPSHAVALMPPGMRRNYHIHAAHHRQGGGFGAPSHAPSTSPDSMAWQLLLVKKSSHEGLGQSTCRPSARCRNHGFFLSGHPLLPSVIPGPLASVFIHAIIRHMIQKIGDTPRVMP